MSDLQNPSNELIRMVRLYSTPWEEKSAALKKLHEDYNSKKEQLNIAIKKLQLIDAHVSSRHVMVQIELIVIEFVSFQSKRIEKERRVMNWEKLFCRLTAKVGHGRRWKFHIDAFKRHANAGFVCCMQHAR